jgi:hypothetical protein
MPGFGMIAPILLSLAMAEDPPIVVKAYPWAPFISPMGEPYRSQIAGDAPIARWFARADRNQDGALTSDEMQADADRFFKRLDSDQDGRIGPEEIKTYEWEIAPEIQVNSDWRRPRGGGSWKQPKDAHDGYSLNGLQGAARYGVLNIPQPVAGADADFNRAVTLAEFRQAASYRFTLLAGQETGQVTLAELEERLPTRPKGKRDKHRKKEKDNRVGVPLPQGD